MYNILICDDEQDIVNALKIYLSGGDYCLFEASNGREALEVVEKNDIHLILMDIMMPVMDSSVMIGLMIMSCAAFIMHIPPRLLLQQPL